MKDKVTLYIATHNKTGKKYFGKTAKYFTQEDLQKYYHGSGKYWNNHIKKHGDDITMEIYGIYSIDENAEDYVEPIALKFSEENNIVKNYDTWANMKEENGLDGGSDICSEKTKIKIGNANRGKKRSEETKKKISLETIKRNTGLKHSKDRVEKMRKSLTGYKHTDEARKNMSNSQKGRKKAPNSGVQKGTKLKTIKCPYCDKEGSISNMKRWHFDKCKFKIINK